MRTARRSTRAKAATVMLVLSCLTLGCAHGRQAAAAALDCPEEQVSEVGAAQGTWSGCGRTAWCHRETVQVGPPSLTGGVGEWRLADTCGLTSESLRATTPTAPSSELMSQSTEALQLELMRQGCAEPEARTLPTANSRWLVSACGRTWRCSSSATNAAGYECADLEAPVPDTSVVAPPLAPALPPEPRRRPLGSGPAPPETSVSGTPEARLAETLALCERDGLWPEAKAAWREFLRTSKEPGAQLRFARWLWAHDFNDEALTEARAARAAQPHLLGLHALLAVILAANHQPEEAERERKLGVAEAAGADAGR